MLHKRFFPPLGMRIVKTGIAVFICLIIFLLLDIFFGYDENVGASIIAAIICMQPFVEDSRSFARDRILGTVLGAMWSLIFLLLMRYVPIINLGMLAVYIVMALFVIMALYSTVLIKKTSVASLVTITMMCAINSYPDVSAPLTQTLTNLAATIIGTTVAIFVNIAHMPRQKHPEYLFFVRTMDIVPDRYAQVPSSVHIALDQLYKDGAKICLISRWAPAFIISQMGLLNVNAPMIIMDGAGLYDVCENHYLDVIDIPKANVARLRSILAGFGASFNIYAVNEHTTLIYHVGETNEAERREFEAMRRSLYRNYMDGSYHDDDFIAFVRVIDEAAKIEELAYRLRGVLPSGMFRMEERVEARFPEYKGLYFYNPKANAAEMMQRVKKIMEKKYDMELTSVTLEPTAGKFLPEHDAMMLMNRLKNKYEPISFFDRSTKKK